MPLVNVHGAVGAAVTLALCALAWWVRAELDQQLPPGFPFLTFFPVVIVTSFLFGARIGALGAIVCGLIAWHQFVPPTGSWVLNWGGVLAMLFYAFITLTDVLLVHWMQQSNGRLRVERETSARLAETRELLFRELQHRVSNNLQMVAGMINLQRRQVSDERALAALDEASRRLHTIGRISRQLYKPDGESEDLPHFLDQLATDVVDASGREGIEVSLDAASAARIPVEPDSAIPIALIVAEAIANSIEHGFEGRQNGRVAIRLDRPQRDMLAIEIEDDGRGLPAGFKLDASESLGLRIASLLARQMNATFNLVRAPTLGGAMARLEFQV